LERILLDHQVELFYDTRFCDVVKHDSRIDALIVENKSGRFAIATPVVVEASGDADVCARAGEKTVSLNTNVRAGWFYYIEEEDVRLNKLSQDFPEDGSKPFDDEYCYSGDTGQDVSAHMIESRKLLRAKLDALRIRSSKSHIYPILIPTIPSFRMTRRLKGAYELTLDDDKRAFDDAIGMIGNWRRRGPSYAIPLRCLTGIATGNLITAGRCISAASAWDQTRAIPACAVTGQAAGTAAALFVQQQLSCWDDLEFATLKAALLRNKVIGI
jgi:hypothetical protein